MSFLDWIALIIGLPFGIAFTLFYCVLCPTALFLGWYRNKVIAECRRHLNEHGELPPIT